MECEVPINPDPDNPYGTLSNFEIDKKIGKGQFSEVWRARCKIDGSIVALKKVQVNPGTEIINLSYDITALPFAEIVFFKS